MREDAAFEKVIELVFDKLGQARTGFRFNLSQEGLEMFLHQPVQCRLLRAPSLVVERVARRRKCELLDP